MLNQVSKSSQLRPFPIPMDRATVPFFNAQTKPPMRPPLQPALQSPGRMLAGIALSSFASLLLGIAPNASAQTTSVIDFDTAGNWIPDGTSSLTSYANHGYAEADWSFQGVNCLRNGTALQDGFPGAIGTYAFRLRDATTSLTATYNAATTIIGFGFDARRWDGSPDPNLEIQYSVDGAVSFLPTGTTINNAFLDESSAFKTFMFNLPEPAQVAAGEFVVRITYSSGERIMVDDFQWTYQAGADVTSPTISALSPVNGADDVLTGATLGITFDETVQPGNGNVFLYQGASIVETFPASSGIFDGASVTFTPSSPLFTSTEYHVIVEATAIQDLAGNTFSGLPLNTDWAFTTAAPDTTPPAPDLFPLDDSLDFVATASIELSYDEPVMLGSGVIELFDASDALVESFDVATSPRVTFADNKLLLDPTSPLVIDSAYYISVPAGVVEDLVGNPSDAIAGPAGWNFTTRGVPAVVISQYYEGVNPSRYIELHNTTGNPVDLTGYQLAAFSTNQALGAEAWKTGQASDRVTDLTGFTIPANGYFLVAQAGASIPSYASPDLIVDGGCMAFAGTASVVLYGSASFDTAEVIDAIAVTVDEAVDISFYRMNNLPGFDFNSGSSILDYVGSGQPWASKTVAEVDLADLSDPWLLRGTTELVLLTITLDATTVNEDELDPVSATVTRSSSAGELIVFVVADNPSAISYVTDDFIIFSDGVNSAEVEILPVDTPFATGDRIVTLTATSDFGVVDGTAQLTVQDKPGDAVFPVVINEIDADTPGTDIEEFVELYNNSSVEVSLDGAVLVFYNGFDDQSYRAINLAGFTIPANGFFVIGNEAILAAEIIIPSNGIQNGADAVGLYYGVDVNSFPNGTPVTAVSASLIDAVVYGTNDADDAGLLAALTPMGTQINEGPNSTEVSIARIPDGGAGFDTSVWVAQLPTPGYTNVIPAPPATDFASWIAGYPGVGALDGPLDDADGDGIPNILEHVLGFAPDVANNGSLVTTSDSPPGSVGFVHTRIKPADLASDVVQGYEWSTNLVDWTAGGDSFGGVTVGFGAPVVIDDTNPVFDVVEVTATVTTGSAERLFVRLAASVATP